MWSSASWHWLRHNVRCSHLPQVSDFICIFILARSVQNPLVLRHIFLQEAEFSMELGRNGSAGKELRDSLCLVLWHQVWKGKPFLG